MEQIRATIDGRPSFCENMLAEFNDESVPLQDRVAEYCEKFGDDAAKKQVQQSKSKVKEVKGVEELHETCVGYLKKRHRQAFINKIDSRCY